MINMRSTESAEKTRKSNDSWEKAVTKTKIAPCIEDADCDDLEKRKLYQILPDEEATQEGYLRVVDESGEDYLYPESYFHSR